MKRRIALVLVGLLTFGLVAPSFAWDSLGHQILCPASVRLASNDGGQNFAAARAILEQYASLMNEAVIAPDTNAKLISPPIWPPLFHGHEAMTHVGFDGLERHDSEVLVVAYFNRAREKWRAGDIPGALYDLGCGMHVVQDAAFCGHSNILFFPHLGKHSAFENWVRDQTAPSKKPKSFEQLHNEAWLVETGGIYLRESWRDDQRKEHWLGGLESWIDVAAHLSYNCVTEAMALDYSSCEFNGQARQQFVAAQRCGAGLLVDFFRKVGVIEEPWIYYLRNGEVCRFRLGGDTPERLGPQDRLNPSDLWPTTSPDGKSRLRFGAVMITGYDESQALSIESPPCPVWSWQFDRLEWPSAPRRIGRAFYLNNFLVALTDAFEGDNWKRLYLIHGKPQPDVWYDCPEAGVQYFFNTPDDLQLHHIQVVELPG